ncbi:hypothetical protein C8Q78DRAFT_1053852 [Trametes maxima]|nr:hypothetical protein C8Q78DRAFT_1053852 [Trametes maxima]
MTLSTLPTEVVELILISTAAGGFPAAIATFSQTCRALRDLIYGSSDQHLWREIFLTTFDDPRVSGGGPGWQVHEEHGKANPPTKDPAFDWGEEFRTRIWAASYIRRRTDTPPHGHFVYESSDLEELQLNSRVFDALISVIGTALPFPPTVVISFLPPTSTTDKSIPTFGAEYPTFPPLPRVKGGSCDAQSNGSRSKSEHSFNTRNMEWVRSTLARGYPPAVTARFSGTRWDGGVAGQLLDEDEFREMQLAGRLIACTGFIPIPSTRSPQSDALNFDQLGPSYMSEENQRKRARRLARMRVYNMRYLQRERHWGPFLPHIEKISDTVLAPPDDDELLRPILALFRMPHHHDHNHDEDDEDEEDELEEEEEGEAGGVVEDVHDDENADDPPSPRARPPPPALLRPDWAYLAAVRTVVESNLNESFAEEDLQGLVSLEGLRTGSAPWDATQYQLPVEDGSQSEKAKAKAKGGDDVEGWDWAGVTGAWKRCVCWMDYRDLILHNLSGEFDDPSLGEAVRVISMNLRAESYSPCTVPGYEHLPTIHVEGRTSGASASGQPRRIHGTVGVIADGSVRWSLFSSVDGADVDEWVSEGVQIGGAASAMGVLGMWTGAQHERMDPLGPCWAWKVG